MLKLAEEQVVDRLVGFLENQGALGCRIGAYLRCYRTEMNDIYFWFQESDGVITTVVSKVDGNMTVCSTESSDFDEIKEFVRIIGFSSLFMPYDDFCKIGIKPDNDGAILKYEGNSSLSDISEIVFETDMKVAYELLCRCQSESISMPDYLPWLSDFTYKRNRNSARARCIHCDGLQVCLAMTSAETDKSALISGVVTDSNYRKRGFASALVTALSDELKKEKKAVYIMTANSNNRKFYEKNSFVCTGKWGSVIG